MPIYEYHCSACNKNFEELVTSSGEKVTCPKCGGKKVKKLMSACAHRSRGADGSTTMSSSAGGCSSCSGGSCSSCGH